MNETAQETSLAQMSARIDGIILGLKWMACLLVVFLSIPNFFASLTIGKFAQIFQDALPGRPLPMLTVGIIYLRMVLPAFALAWPVVGIVSIIYSKQFRTWVIGTGIIIGLIVLQFILTWIGLFAPMTELITGMSATS